MRVTRWGDSLAVRLPAPVVEALELKEGDDIEVQVVGRAHSQVAPASERQSLVAELRRYRGTLPENFRFDRLDAHGLE
jgi:antitoxin MazE